MELRIWRAISAADGIPNAKLDSLLSARAFPKSATPPSSSPDSEPDRFLPGDRRLAPLRRVRPPAKAPGWSATSGGGGGGGRPSAPSPTFLSSAPSFHHQCSCPQCEFHQAVVGSGAGGEANHRIRGLATAARDGMGNNIIILPAAPAPPVAAAETLPHVAAAVPAATVLGLCQSCQRLFRPVKKMSCFGVFL